MKIYKNHKFQKALENYYDSLSQLKKFNIGQKIVCDIGEQFVKRIFDIRLIKYKNNPSIDGIDKNGKRVQIKTRHSHKENPNPYAFRPFNRKYLKNIDYVLLVIIDEKFWIKEIWRIERKDLQKNLSKKTTDGFNLTNGVKKTQIVKQVYP